jgi:hypothetical protein
VSLILDALRKLERDKDRPDPSVVVVGSVPWQGVADSRRVPFAAGAIVAVCVLAGAALLLARRSPAPAPAAAPPPGATAPAALASPAYAAPGGPAAPARPLPPAVAPASRPALGPVPASRRLAVPGTAAGGTAAAPLAAAADEARVAPGPATSERLQLMAISQRDGQPVAIISDRLVREGDSFDGVKVLRIGATEVEVDDRGQRRVLKF